MPHLLRHIAFCLLLLLAAQWLLPAMASPAAEEVEMKAGNPNAEDESDASEKALAKWWAPAKSESAASFLALCAGKAPSAGFPPYLLKAWRNPCTPCETPPPNGQA